MVNTGIIVQSYWDVYENVPANSRPKDVVIDDTEMDAEENENTDLDAESE